MPTYFSPLRYPGGKASLAPVLASIIRANCLEGAIYCEPFAGGAGAALTLLYTEMVDHIFLNDLDFRIAAFWRSILRHPRRFKKLVASTPITIKEWRNQRAIYRRPRPSSYLRTGFATFFLNRCNRSGIISSGGPIGGFAQGGKWKLDARFDKQQLVDRIDRIIEYKERITFECMDALDLLKTIIQPVAEQTPVFVYLDPPYFRKSKDLYLNAFGPQDHQNLADYLRKRKRFNWVMTYDDTPEIRSIYSDFVMRPFRLSYSAHSRRIGGELLISDARVKIPSDIEDLITLKPAG